MLASQAVAVRRHGRAHEEVAVLLLVDREVIATLLDRHAQLLERQVPAVTRGMRSVRSSPATYDF